ncbi:hypothetical protein R6Z07F_018930 [Ovis aries]
MDVSRAQTPASGVTSSTYIPAHPSGWWTPQSWVPPTTTSLWSFHPLGVLALGVFSTFNTETSGFSHLFPGLQPHLLSLPCRLHLPVFQDYTLCAVGRPIPVPQCPQPPEEQVDRYHVLYMKAVEQLLEEHRRAAASRLLLASPSPWPHPSPPPGPPSP